METTLQCHQYFLHYTLFIHYPLLLIELPKLIFCGSIHSPCGLKVLMTNLALAQPENTEAEHFELIATSRVQPCYKFTLLNSTWKFKNFIVAKFYRALHYGKIEYSPACQKN